jgi:hypothetical protein
MELEPWEISEDIIEAPKRLWKLEYLDRLRPLKGKKLAFPENGSFTLPMLEYYVGSCRMNLGMRLHGGLVVVDCDGPDLGPLAGLESPMRVRTRRGWHHYYRTETDHKNLIHPAGLSVDVIFHGVTPLPPSVNWETGWMYRWEGLILPEEELPLFPMEILREFDPPPARPKQRAAARRTLGHIRDIRAYISRIVAIEGQGGDRTTFRVACLIARATGGDYYETLSRLREWNESNASPRWSEKELAHKAQCAVLTVGLTTGDVYPTQKHDSPLPHATVGDVYPAQETAVQNDPLLSFAA